MPRLELISFDDGFCRSYLEQFKQYASVPDDRTAGTPCSPGS